MDTKMLSQWEIDSLLSNMAPDKQEGKPPEEDRAIKDYDFRRPDKFSKDHIRALQNIFESFANLTTTSLASHLRAPLQVHLSSVEQIVYDEYVEQLPNPTLMNVVNILPFGEHIILELNLPIAYCLLDRLLGGRGDGSWQVREPTEMERELLRGLFAQMLECYREAWSGVASLSLEVEEMVLNPQLLLSTRLSGAAFLAVLEVRLSANAGTMSVCIPYTTLEPVMAKLNPQMWLGGNRGGPNNDLSEMLLAQLNKVEVEVAVELGQAQVSVRDLLGLQEGNVVLLNTRAGDCLQMAVGGNNRFLGRPGLVGGKVAIEVSKVLEQE